MKAIVFSPLAEPQEVARKPGVRQGGLSPGGYRRERDYSFLFQPAPRETGRWPQKPPQGRGGVFKRGEAPFAPRGSALWKKDNGQQKNSPKLKEERWLNKYSVFCVKITILYECGTTSFFSRPLHECARVSFVVFLDNPPLLWYLKERRTPWRILPLFHRFRPLALLISAISQNFQGCTS
jgi:hypothetical protein